MTPLRRSASATAYRRRRSTRSFADGLVRLPHPFTAADRCAGYRYELSVLQAEFSLSQVPYRPRSGRVFFEQLIRDNFDLGRPDKATDLSPPRAPARPAPDPVAVAYPRADRQCHPVAARRLQTLEDQAVPQAATSDQNRNHDQRHPGLRHRQTAEEPARTAAGRLRSQPAPARHPTAWPRPNRLSPGTAPATYVRISSPCWGCRLAP